MRENEQLIKVAEKRRTRLAVEAPRRVVKVSVAILLMAAAMIAATMMNRAQAADVPIYSACWSDNQTGYYHWETDASGNLNHYIEVNDCALERLGAGPQDRDRVIAHEMGHANGLPHSADPSDIMYPVIPVYGY